MQEYTLIICVGAEDKDNKLVGGETMLYLAPDRVHSSNVTGKPGGALCFRKDIEHERKSIKERKKEIITMNLWLTKKDRSRVLHATFPDGETNAVENAGEDRSYAISVDALLKQFPDSHLSGFVRFADAKVEPGQMPESVVAYECTAATYD